MGPSRGLPQSHTSLESEEEQGLEERIPASPVGSPFSPIVPGGSYIQGTSKEQEECRRYPPAPLRLFLGSPFVSPSPSQSLEHGDEVEPRGEGGMGGG